MLGLVQTPGTSSQSKLFLLGEVLMLWCLGRKQSKKHTGKSVPIPKGLQFLEEYKEKNEPKLM